MVRRLANSLSTEWRSRQPRPEDQTTTDFQSEMAAGHRQRALRIVAPNVHTSAGDERIFLALGPLQITVSLAQLGLRTASWIGCE